MIHNSISKRSFIQSDESTFNINSFIVALIKLSSFLALIIMSHYRILFDNNFWEKLSFKLFWRIHSVVGLSQILV